MSAAGNSECRRAAVPTASRWPETAENATAPSSITRRAGSIVTTVPPLSSVTAGMAFTEVFS